MAYTNIYFLFITPVITTHEPPIIEPLKGAPQRNPLKDPLKEPLKDPLQEPLIRGGPYMPPF